MLPVGAAFFGLIQTRMQRVIGKRLTFSELEGVVERISPEHITARPGLKKTVAGLLELSANDEPGLF